MFSELKLQAKIAIKIAHLSSARVLWSDNVQILFFLACSTKNQQSRNKTKYGYGT